MKKKIIADATTLFSNKGTMFSMNELANIVGLKAPSIYNYYSSKEELVLDVIECELDSYYAYFNNVFMSSNEPSEKLIKRVFYSIVEYFSDPGKAKFWKRLGLLDELIVQRVRNLLIEKDKTIIQKIHAAFEDCIDQGKIIDRDVEGLSFHFYMIVQGILSNSIYYSRDNVYYKKAVDKVWNSFWAGVTCSDKSG